MTVLKTKAGLARMLKRVVDEWYPVAQRLTLVVDNLSTHEPSVLYEVFAPAEARLIDRLEFVYTPKHGSWLNMAEIELSVLARQCLDRRSPDMNTLRSEIAAWLIERNATSVRVDWQFTPSGARTKFNRLYPVLEPANSGVTEHWAPYRDVAFPADPTGDGGEQGLDAGLGGGRWHRLGRECRPGWRHPPPFLTFDLLHRSGGLRR